MTIQRACWLTLAAVVAFTPIANQDLLGQNSYPQGYGYSAQPPAFPMVPSPGGYAMPVNHQNMPMMMVDSSSAFYQEPVLEDGMVPMDSGGFEDSRYGYYEPSSYRGLGAIGTVLAWLAPYNEGTCCTPHWFDVEAEAVFLKLDDDGYMYEFSRDTSGQTMISSGDLIPDTEAGLRITGALQVGAGSNLEVTYMGLFDHQRGKTVSGDNNLNSIFSDFRDLAPPDGLEQFDLADVHDVLFANNLDSIELNYRRRWMGPSCIVQGSWLVGVRYFKMEEMLRFHSEAARDTTGENHVPPDDVPDGVDDTGGIGEYLLKTNNDMTGFQGGGDVWVCLLPGLHLGMEGKGGIYGNNARQWTEMWGIDYADDYIGIIPAENLKDGVTSFVGELSFMMNYRLNHKWTVRAGYEMLWIQNVSLASRNFNPDVDAIAINGRIPFIDNKGSAYYHGFTIGAEWMW